MVYRKSTLTETITACLYISTNKKSWDDKLKLTLQTKNDICTM